MTAEALAAPALEHVRGRGLDPKDAEDKAFIASVREHEACEGGCSWSDVGSANGEDVCTTCVDEYTAGFAEADDDEAEGAGSS